MIVSTARNAMTIRLHINVDHVATVRNARGMAYPDPVFAAQVCERAGADGITAHLREDRRHILDRDVVRLREVITTFFNLETAPTDEMLKVALTVRPDAVTLVPERRQERTTEGGLDVVTQKSAVADHCRKLMEAGIRVSLFIAPDLKQVDVARELGVAQVEFHTGEYCHAEGKARTAHLELLQRASAHATALGIEVAAGHGLTRHNVAPIAAIASLAEVNIGHSVVSDALFGGLDASVRDLRDAIERGARDR